MQRLGARRMSNPGRYEYLVSYIDAKLHPAGDPHPMSHEVPKLPLNMSYAGLRYDSERNRYLVFVQEGTSRPRIVGKYSTDEVDKAERHFRELNREFAGEEVYAPDGPAANGR